MLWSTGADTPSHAIARDDHTLHLPENLSTKEGAALPEALLTVWHNVFHLGQLQPRGDAAHSRRWQRHWQYGDTNGTRPWG